MKTLCFLIIKKLTTSSQHVKDLAAEVNLLTILSDKLNLTLMVMQHNRFLETTKKTGVTKVRGLRAICFFKY